MAIVEGVQSEPQLDDLAGQYADAVIEALAATATATGKADVNAALAGLAFAEGYLIAKLSRSDRLKARAILIDKLDEFTRDFVNARVLETAEPAGSA